MSSELLAFIVGAGLNFAVAFLIVRFVYYPLTQDKTYVFTFLTFNTIIYFVMSLLTSVEIGVGVGFGLFAIFSVLRYRTDEIPIREMTYLFVIIALPVVNAMLIAGQDVAQLLLADLMVLAVLYVLEREWGFQFATSQRVIYEQIELITPANRQILLADLRERTGLPVKRVEIGRIDFLRDTAELTIFYDSLPPDSTATNGDWQSARQAVERES